MQVIHICVIVMNGDLHMNVTLADVSWHVMPCTFLIWRIDFTLKVSCGVNICVSLELH